MTQWGSLTYPPQEENLLFLWLDIKQNIIVLVSWPAKSAAGLKKAGLKSRSDVWTHWIEGIITLLALRSSVVFVKLAREEALSTLPAAMSATLQDYNSKTTALYAFEVLVLRFWIQSLSGVLEEMAKVNLIWNMIILPDRKIQFLKYKYFQQHQFSVK